MFIPGQMVVMQVTRVSYQLNKGDTGIVVNVKNKDAEVEWMKEGQPPRRVTVHEDDLAPMARPRDVVGEGKEALGLRNVIIGVIGTYETLEEVSERLGHVSAAADQTTRLAYALKCDVKDVESTVAALSDRAHALANEMNVMRENAQKHHLVIIGPSTLKRVYVDVARDEAVKRYLIEHERAEIGDIPVSELDVGESFSATGVGPE